LSQSLNPMAAELLFWLATMADHASLIQSSIMPQNTHQLLVAENFRAVLQRASQKIKAASTLETAVFGEILTTLLSFREFKRELLGAILSQAAVTTLSPSLYSLMLNELEEFLRILGELQAGGVSDNSALGRHLLWIFDAAGHAAWLTQVLDRAEYLYRDEAKAYENAFDKMYLKAVAQAGFYRSETAWVEQSLQHFNRQMLELMKEFVAFLTELQSGMEKGQILGNSTQMLPAHMIREANYYLCKIGEGKDC
jgi:small-conductance mechanosensitive channel